MKIKDLKKILDDYPDDLDIVVDGYEGGYDDLLRDNVHTLKIQRNVNNEWYYGDHDDPSDVCDKKIEPALLIGRRCK